MSLKLLTVRKLGAMMEKITIAANNINKGVYLLAKIPIDRDRFLNSVGWFSITVFLRSCSLRIYLELVKRVVKGASFGCNYPKD